MVFIDLPTSFLSIVAVFSHDPSNVSLIASTLVTVFAFLLFLSASRLSYNHLLFASPVPSLLLRRPRITLPCWLMLFLSSITTLTSRKLLFMLVLIIVSVRTGIAVTLVLIVVTIAMHPAPTFVVTLALRLTIAVLFVPTIAQLAAKNFVAMPAALLAPNLASRDF
jgi:hypothetical protein